MESRTAWSELQDFFRNEYGIFSMSLTTEYMSEGVAEIEMRESGFMKLMNDLILLKESKYPPQEEIKCTFDEAMNFN